MTQSAAPTIDVYGKDATVLGKGPVSVVRKLAWKNGKRILSCADDKITVIGIRPSGITDYAILGVTVSWPHGSKRSSLCHTHRVNVCAHTRRIDRYRRENPL